MAYPKATIVYVLFVRVTEDAVWVYQQSYTSVEGLRKAASRIYNPNNVLVWKVTEEGAKKVTVRR